jgi:hypothetical protein
VEVVAALGLKLVAQVVLVVAVEVIILRVDRGHLDKVTLVVLVLRQLAVAAEVALVAEAIMVLLLLLVEEAMVV